MASKSCVECCGYRCKYTNHIHRGALDSITIGQITLTLEYQYTSIILFDTSDYYGSPVTLFSIENFNVFYSLFSTCYISTQEGSIFVKSFLLYLVLLYQF